MCPWCVIGYRQLAAALRAQNTDHEIYWHPFELNSDMPATGQDMRAHLAEKYGVSPEQSDANRATMTALGAQLGFAFNFVDGFRMHNTFNAHQILHWAGEHDRKHDLKQAMFEAHFTHACDLSNDAVLIEIASELGLDRSEAAAVLADQRFAADVRLEQEFWRRQGINGVPAIVFDRQHLVTGAQGVETYDAILTQLKQMQE